MQTWTLGAPFSPDQLEEALAEASLLPPSVTAPPRALTLDRGYSQVRSQSVIAREPAGPPLPGGAFLRACALISAFEHSDPRIVMAHFDPRVPLLHRPVLLELQSLGLRFLAPVRVAELRRQSDATHTVFGFQLQTLRGHLERGREWFLLEKHHPSGEVRFRIEAAWRPGQFPSWWSRLGFHLLGRRYQRAWHRLAHQRLRRLLAQGATARAPFGVVHHQRALDDEPVHIVAQRGLAGRRLEQELERLPRDVRVVAVELGLLAALRSLAPLATLAGGFGGPAPLPALPHPPRGLSLALSGLALAEAVADKSALLPSRARPLPVLGRTAVALLCGGAPFSGRARGEAALLAGGCAAVGSVLIARVRRLLARGRWSNLAAGLAEDALALGLGVGISRRLAQLSRIRGAQAPGVGIEQAVRLHRRPAVASGAELR